MPTFSLQCGPNADPNIRKVRNADPMPPLRTFLAALLVAHELVYTKLKKSNGRFVPSSKSSVKKP